MAVVKLRDGRDAQVVGPHPKVGAATGHLQMHGLTRHNLATYPCLLEQGKIREAEKLHDGVTDIQQAEVHPVAAPIGAVSLLV